jgi:hypothetical protein
MIRVDVGRFSGHTRTLLTRDWEVIPAEFAYPPAAAHPGRPKQSEQMLQVAEVAGKDIDFVRVDIYDSVRGDHRRDDLFSRRRNGEICTSVL